MNKKLLEKIRKLSSEEFLELREFVWENYEHHDFIYFKALNEKFSKEIGKSWFEMKDCYANGCADLHKSGNNCSIARCLHPSAKKDYFMKALKFLILTLKGNLNREFVLSIEACLR